MDPVLFCSRQKSLDLPNSFTNGRRCREGKNVFAWHLGDNTEIEPLKCIIGPAYIIKRYLDFIYVLLPSDDSIAHQQILDEIFDSVATWYDHLINRAQNLENIHNLLLEQQRHLGSLDGRTLVDFGCGTGLSTLVASKFRVNVVGIERSSIMRRCADARGMRAMALDDFQTSNQDNLDGIIASYVLHLPFDLMDLELVWARLSPGSAMVANFHKNTGLERVDTHMRRLKASFCEVPHSRLDSIHGTQRKYVRQT